MYKSHTAFLRNATIDELNRYNSLRLIKARMRISGLITKCDFLIWVKRDHEKVNKKK